MHRKKALIICVSTQTYLTNGSLDSTFLSTLLKEIEFLLRQGVYVYLVGCPSVYLGLTSEQQTRKTRLLDVEIIASAHKGYSMWQRELHAVTMHRDLRPQYIESIADQFNNGVTIHLRNVCAALCVPAKQQFVCMSENTNMSISESRMFLDVAQYLQFTEELLKFIKNFHTETYCLMIREQAICGIHNDMIRIITSPRLLQQGTRDKHSLGCNQAYPALDAIVKVALRCMGLSIPCAVVSKEYLETIRFIGSQQFIGNYFSPDGNKFRPLL